MLIRLMRFHVKAKYVPGKDMLAADTLSRSPVATTESSSHEEIQAHVSDVRSSWQVSDAGLAKIRAGTLKDVNLKEAVEYTIHGLPQYKEDVQLAARDFTLRGELSLHGGLLVRGDRIVVPSTWETKFCKGSTRATWAWQSAGKVLHNQCGGRGLEKK